MSSHDPFRLIRVIHSLNPETGGPPQGIRQITPHLNLLGISTLVICLDSPNDPWLEDYNFQILALGPGSKGYGFRFDLLFRLYKATCSADAVIIHGLWQFHSFATAFVLLFLRIPYCVYPHGMLDPWFNHTYKSKYFIKLLYWLVIERFVLQQAAYVLFTTDIERKLASQSFPLYSCRESVLGYGTNQPQAFTTFPNSFLSNYPHLHGKRLLLYLGRIHPKKGIDTLISAFAAVSRINPTLHLVIAGSFHGAYAQSLRAMTFELSIQTSVTWTGALFGNIKWDAFRASELFCLFSHQENFGIAVAEALATGTPVCITDQVNIAEDILSYGAGLVAFDDITSTIQALNSWISLSVDARHAYSVNAIKLFNELYDLRPISVRLGNLLRSL